MNHNGLRPPVLVTNEGTGTPVHGEAYSVVIFAKHPFLERIAKRILRMVHAGLVCDGRG